ncbi:hypothetical protein BVI434_1390036 [Burkholderia vietnamiensis]|nr:hypothetical protein BVI434_1390036 [Burkholderia vietnamiensis]
MLSLAVLRGSYNVYVSIGGSDALRCGPCVRNVPDNRRSLDTQVHGRPCSSSASYRYVGTLQTYCN